MLLLEAAVIVGLFMFSGGPSEVKAEPGVTDLVAKGEEPAEVLILAGKFQNTKSGRSFMYDTEIYVVVKQKHLELIGERKDGCRPRSPRTSPRFSAGPSRRTCGSKTWRR